jgi:hypothetical protein
LDYDPHFVGAKLIELDDQGFPDVKYWDRYLGGFITDEELKKFPDTKTRVQFCKKRGRIPGIFQCIKPGEMSCFEAQGEGNVS